MKNPCKKKSSTLDDDDSDDDYNDDYGEVSESVLLLSGPCGCGKTALVRFAISFFLNSKLAHISVL